MILKITNIRSSATTITFSMGYVNGRVKERYRKYDEKPRTIIHNTLIKILKNLKAPVLKADRQ
ncbi:MAG: hypothetical protein LZ173_06595 [Thaumarchaeota archaeon]|jgi:hypothetical protein|nr:hypothetical protein [Candidatus Geocrenenecus arthurdayi]